MFSMVMRRACSESRSLSASLVNSRVMGSPVKRELAITRRSAPSSSRTFERIRLAMKSATSSLSVTPVASALVLRMAAQVSSSGGSMATVRPQPKRDFRRSSRPATSLG